MAKCSFGTVSERDMDRLFLEAIITDPGFAKTIIDETDLKGTDFKVISVELSKTEVGLGESDITVIIETEGRKHGILIEDKIDAIAMDEQYQRYKKRGDIGVQNGEYDSYDVFIFCPDKYHEANDEAKKYDRFMAYEAHLSYFKSKSDPISNVRCQQLEQAITKAKKPPQVTLNVAANSFFVNYIKYQKEHYPSLDLRTKETSNGYWAQYKTMFGKAYIYHKLQEGYVDFTFPNASDKLDLLQSIASRLRMNGMNKVVAVQTGKASALRIEVPKLCMEDEFEETSEINLIECFDAIQKLNDLANFFEYIISLEATC